MRTEDLLKESQSMAEELQKQQEELRQTNEELEEKATELEIQKKEIENKNVQVEFAKESVEKQAKKLALTSKYKSEFLANMSHELRTPLNSLLLLSNVLSKNDEGNLNEKQVQYAETIQASGSELLSLINDILDLSKIEAGKMTLEILSVSINHIVNTLNQNFRQLSEEKGLKFNIDLDKMLPSVVRTDEKRLMQVLKNLLSNAFKFTDQGRINLNIFKANKGWNITHEILNNAEMVVAFQVIDTGIGIPKEKMDIIFEAFQQVDGTTSRKYGGTGLGLSISREITRILGGEIIAESKLQKGSSFTLYLPQTYVPLKKLTKKEMDENQKTKLLVEDTMKVDGKEAFIKPYEIKDDRENIQEGDRIFLIIEDDVKFANILIEKAHDYGFKALVASNGETGLTLAQAYKPDAITLDIKLPDLEGWTVLDILKHKSATRHIPVHIISIDDKTQKAMKMGALSYLTKPVTEDALVEAFNKISDYIDRKMKKLLVVEDNDAMRQSIIELIGNSDVETTAVDSGNAALELLKREKFDCMVLDLGLPDISGADLVKKINKELGLVDLPIIIYTGKEISAKEELELKRVSESIIIKDAVSMERLLAETSLFLHRVEEKLPENKRNILKSIHEKDPFLKDKKILVVDDDVRNIFALITVLEQQEMNVLHAETGKAGIETLQKNPDIDVVLMDIMMPIMDGYEAIKRIRAMDEFKNLPIIALTAKAMKGDREECIEVGASDYLAKPIKDEQLMSLLRVWLYK